MRPDLRQVRHRVVRRTAAALLSATLLGALALQAAPPPSADEPKLPADRLETQNGTVTVEAVPGESSSFQAQLDGQKLADLEGYGATIVAHLGHGMRDYVLLEVASGGIACPYQYQLVALAPKRAPVLSDPFGSCAAWKNAAFQGAKVLIRMPAYTPHPDLLTAAEVRRNERTTYLYLWNQLTLEEKKVVAK